MTDDALDTGQAALREGRWADARDAFGDALSGAEDEISMPAALAGLGEALWWLGETRRSISCRERAYAGFRRVGDPIGAVAAASDLSISYKADFGNDATASGWLARAERVAEGTDVGPLQGWLLLIRGYLMRDKDPVGSQLYADKALRFARERGDVDLELTALTDMGVAFVVRGEAAKGFSLIDEALAGALGGERTRLITVVFTSCAMLIACDLAGDLERALQWTRVIEGFIEKFGCPFLYAECRTRYGGLLLSNGQWERAESELTAALAATSEVAPGLHDQALARLAELRLRQGRLEDAAALLAAVRNQFVAVLPTAGHRLAHGSADGMAPLLERRMRHLGAEHVEVSALLAMLVDVYLARGEIDHGAETATRLAECAADLGRGLSSALATRAWARVAAARGDAETAAAEFERALVQFAELDLPFETAQVRMELARVVAHRCPDVAIAEARSALTSFERLGASTYIDAVHAILRQLGVAARSRTPSAGSVLTAREQEVLQLVGLGLSNPEIASRLFISRKTAAHHVSNLLSKLGLRNRAEAAAYATRRLKPDLPTS